MIARLSRPVSMRRLKAEERIAVEATPEERVAIAEELDLLSLDRLAADVVLKPWRITGLKVSGTVRGEVTQACVATLEPVASVIEETFELALHPDAAESVEVEVDPGAEDPPERLESGVVDIGAIVLEHFALGIDPYPRTPGAVFDTPEEDEEPSPFASLAALKDRLN